MTDTLMNTAAPEVRDRRRLRVPEAAALVAFPIAEIIFFAIGSPYFLSAANFLNILTAIAVTGVLAAGATVLLIAGQFDLSVGSGIAFVGLTLALTAPVFGLPTGIMLAVIAGLAIGALNGFLVTIVGVNALITTLGTMAIFRGLTISLGEGRNIPVTGFDWAIQRPILGIPMPVIVLAVVVIVIGVLLHSTRYGRSIYAIGANESAARLVGIRNRKLLFIAFLISGACIVIGGLMNASLLGSTSGTTGLGLELAAVTAVILGGASLKGGIGSVFGTVLGLLIVGVMSNGLTLMNVASSWQDVASGALLILAVSFDRVRQKLEARR